MTKSILFLALFALLLATIGCIVPVGERGERHGHSRHEDRGEVIVGPPVVVVRPPEVIIH